MSGITGCDSEPARKGWLFPRGLRADRLRDGAVQATTALLPVLTGQFSGSATASRIP
jgi:hypothetical protein